MLGISLFQGPPPKQTVLPFETAKKGVPKIKKQTHVSHVKGFGRENPRENTEAAQNYCRVLETAVVLCFIFLGDERKPQTAWFRCDDNSLVVRRGLNIQVELELSCFVEDKVPARALVKFHVSREGNMAVIYNGKTLTNGWRT